MTVTQDPRVVTAQVQGQRVLLSPDLEYFALDATGSIIWDLLAEPQTVETLTTALTTQFEVDVATAQADVTRFVDALARIGCVTHG